MTTPIIPSTRSHNTLSIKQGDKGLVRSWLINTLYYFDSDKKIDIMDYMYNELRLCVIERRCCIYDPYLQLLIEQCIGTEFHNYPLTTHMSLSMSLL
jgi:hypothetical protein